MWTPAEAAERWCPFVRARGGDNRGTTFEGGVDEAARCIGSDCMAWRWGVETVDKDTGFKVTTGELYKRMKAGEPAEQFHERWASHGYCGLAGTPR